MNDDNLTYTPVDPVRDRVRRMTPALAIRMQSPRWSARVTAGVDSERYTNQRWLDDDHARERADVALTYAATPRMSLGIDANYLDTNTAADLNRDTSGLAALRVRGRRFEIAPKVSVRMSSTMTFVASQSSVATSVSQGMSLRSRTDSFGVADRFTPRDIINIDYEQSRLDFKDTLSQTIHSQAVLFGWSHDFRRDEQLILRAGPRFTDGRVSPDVALSLRRGTKRRAVILSVARTRTTVIGHVGDVATDMFQARFSGATLRRFRAYAAPAVFRSIEGSSRALVYRFSAGVSYALAPLLDLNVEYLHDSQYGALDPTWSTVGFSRSTFSVGLRAVLARRDTEGDR